MRIFEHRSETWLARTRAEVFEFFSDAGNLERLTPPWLGFEILTPRPIAMRAGALIDYRLKVHHVPVRWRTEITAWEPPVRFVDEQRRGPYRLWHHTHTFLEQEGGTWVHDRVRYAVLGGILIHKLVVARDVKTIFAYREKVLQELFPPAAA